MSYLERIFQVLDEPITVEDSPNAIDMPEIRGDVSFENVEFEYEKGVPVIKGVSFEVKAASP